MYRAPEVILTEEDYDDKIDMWSLGVVLTQLLGAVDYPNKAKAPKLGKYIFIGGSCYPISPSDAS
jgi:serine/threonine protein kinase